MNVFSYIEKQRAAGKKMLAVLLDPEKTPIAFLPTLCTYLSQSCVDLIFVGGSTDPTSIDTFIKALKVQLSSVQSPVLSSFQVVFNSSLLRQMHFSFSHFFRVVILRC